MKTFIRNFLHVISRFRVSTLLNFCGLIISFTAFIVIAMYAVSENSFESVHENANQIVRLERVYPSASSWIQARPFSDAVIKSSPHIKAGTIINPFLPDMYFTINEGEAEKGFKEKVVSCYPDITKIFNFEMIEGDKECLNTPGHLLIPESLAHKVFGNTSVVGRQFRIDTQIWTLPKADFFVVGGVYKDFPQNTQLNNSIYIKIADDRTTTDWNSGNYICYVLLDNSNSQNDIIDNFNNTFDFSLIGNNDSSVKIGFTPLKDIYYLNQAEDANIIKTGNKSTNNILLLIAVLIILVAAINYTNLTTALIPIRIKSINTHKIFGSTSSFLRGMILSEAVIISVLSFIIAVFAVFVINLSGYLSFIGTDLSLSSHVVLLTLTGCLSILIGLFAGLYPTWKMTSYSPALVLKGAYGLSSSGLKLRTLLISFQFIVSFALILATLMIREQNNYMKLYDSGFEKDQIAIIPINQKIYFKQKAQYENKLKENPGIADIAYSGGKFGGSDNYRTWGGTYRGKDLWFYSLAVSWNFADVMGIDLLEGTKPTEAHEQGSTLYYIPNKKMLNEFDMELNSSIDIPWLPDTKNSILGFTDNINFTSLRQNVDWTCFVINDWEAKDYSYIKLKAGSNMKDVINHIYKTFQEIDPAYPVDIQFYDQVFNALYYKEVNMSKIIYLFSFLTIVISLIGIFGLVIFETQYRFKEIGVRKIHGATISNILWIFNMQYVKILIACFILATPLAIYGVSFWLKGFAYKSPIYWWIFALAFIIVFILTTLTVTFQCWKAATMNPINIVKSE